MIKITRADIKRFIQEEIQKIVDEDVLVARPDPHTPPMKALSNEDEDDNSQEIDHDHTSGTDNCPICSTITVMLNEACGCENNKDYAESKSGSSMAKSQLYKTAKYAAQLYHMIPEDYELQDWVSSHISVIADDISEIFHSIDHKIYKGEL